MRKWKAVILVVILAILSGCENDMDKSREIFSTADFPRDSHGYPDSQIVIINGTEYILGNLSGFHVKNSIDQEIELPGLREGGGIEVILPQYIPGFLWSMEEKETIDFIYYEKKALTVLKEVEGKSDVVQKFSFTVTESTDILLKWSNVKECGKSFADKEEDYLLKISISQSE